ncbi:hypothetical protein JRO89_XS14G0034900 [Xanthoceras sorbifolium]|uniref:Uncharacterized protein n=1 Tax=Xanthoceras sorbifolium TaxID=99658 RepID=A0ABQ8H3L5_9ROSI|nr:hypothetical protein JRO89_XS14G0034900 [Xanthoceras sorbifolium]
MIKETIFLVKSRRCPLQKTLLGVLLFVERHSCFSLAVTAVSVVEVSVELGLRFLWREIRLDCARSSDLIVISRNRMQEGQVKKRTFNGLVVSSSFHLGKDPKVGVFMEIAEALVVLHGHSMARDSGLSPLNL